MQGASLTGVKGVQYASTAVTASDAGTAIPAGVTFVTVDADGDSAHIIILPEPVPGTIVWLTENGSTGYEVRSSAPASVAINGGTDTNAESAVGGAVACCRLVCISATKWIGTKFAADGTESKMDAAAA